MEKCVCKWKAKMWTVRCESEVSYFNCNSHFLYNSLILAHKQFKLRCNQMWTSLPLRPCWTLLNKHVLQTKCLCNRIEINCPANTQRIQKLNCDKLKSINSNWSWVNRGDKKKQKQRDWRGHWMFLLLFMSVYFDIESNVNANTVLITCANSSVRAFY